MSIDTHTTRIAALRVLLCAGMAALAGCGRAPEPASPAQAPADTSATTAEPAPAPAVTDSAAPLQDVIEHTPSYVIGISYPPGLDAQPGLVAVVRGYAEAARAELLRAVEGLGNDKPPAPYELSLGFETLLRTPELTVVSAEGSRYTGGAHGEPLVARFVWLNQAQRQLTAEALIPTAQGWGEVGRHVAAQLHAAAEVRATADKLPPDQVATLLDNADKMIAEGTAAKADNFSEFQPLLDAQGKISALRFVFPPYQVGPYADGTQTAEVPAAVLKPLVDPQYAELFAG